MDFYDAVIVGAGPAGCAAACFLSAKGFKVLVVDKTRFPRDKICGDGISASSIQVMEEMGAMEYIEKKSGPFWKYRNIILSSPSGTLMNGPVPFKKGLRDYGYIIPRKKLDYHLAVYTGQQEGVTLLENSRITGLVRENGLVSGVTDGKRSFTGRCIISAEGHYSALGRDLNRKPVKPKFMGFALRGYFSGVEGLKEELEIHYEKSIIPGYGWIFPVGKERANVGVGVMVRFKSYKGIKDLFYRFVENNPYARKHLKKARLEEGTLKAWPLPFGCAPGKRGFKNVLFAGDAGHFVDPLNGEGIYYALKSGKYAALAVEKALKEHNEQQAGKYYEKLWRKEFAFDDFTGAYLIQPFLNNSFFLDLTIKLASKKKSRAQLLSGVIAHKKKKSDLLKLLF